jgi:sporulation-control protein
MMRAFGVGGPTVDTVLSNPNTRPGLELAGDVNIVGGDHSVNIEYVSLGLVTRVEVDAHGGGHDSLHEFHRLNVAGAFTLAEKEQKTIPFRIPVPWETPVTDVYGQRLPGMTMGLRTELAVKGAVDKSDLDAVSVHPLPAQEKILDAFVGLGFRFKSADLERGHIYGLHQTLPFYQEIEFWPAPQYAGAINEVELTFVASPTHVDVVLEFDKRGGFLSPGHDAYGHFRIGHGEVDRTDWRGVVEGWVRQASERYSSLRAAHGHPHHGYHGHRGHGTGAIVAGVAGGVVGGMLLGEAMEEVFDGDDFFE